MNSKFQILVITLLFLGKLKAELQPQAYSESNVRQFSLAVQELKKLNFSGSEKVLDIGSGDGKVSCHIAKEFIPNGHLVGIDKDATMVNFANTHTNKSNTIFICADALDYVAPEEYEVVVSFSALHWVDDYSKVLENIAKSLKSRGMALLCHGAEISLHPFVPIIDKLLDTPKWNAYKDKAPRLKYPSLIDVDSAIKKSGLTVENLELKKHVTWLLPDVLIKNWVSLPLLGFLPADKREEYCKDILQEFMKQYPLNEKNELMQWFPVVVLVLKK